MLVKLWRKYCWRDPERFHFHAGTVRGLVHPKDALAAMESAGVTYQFFDALVDSFGTSLREAKGNHRRLEILKREMMQMEGAARRLIPLARLMFNLPPIDPRTGRGVSDVESIGVAIEFTAYMGLRAVTPPAF